MRQSKLIGAIFLLAVICLIPTILYGVSTAYWELNTKSAFTKGEFNNLVMNPRGEIMLGKKVNRISIDEPSLWCAVRDKKDNIYFGSGTGKIYKLNGDQAQEIFSTGELLVTSLAVSKKNEIFAATIPNGKIFKIDRSGKAITFCVLSDMYVWALAYSHKQNILYAATGPTGKIYKIDKDGNVTEFYDTKKPNILCLTLDKNDNLYFGTASPGILYRLSADGKPWVLHDFGDSEIKALALHNETLYIAVNSGVKTLPQEFLDAVRAAAEKVKKESEDEEKAPKPQEPPSPKQPKPVVQSAVYSLAPDNKLKLIYRFPNSYLTDIKVTKDGELLVGTDNTGKVFKIMPASPAGGPDGVSAIPYDFESEQVLALILDSNGELAMAGTGKPGHVFILEEGSPEKAYYTSKVFDAVFPASWGSLAWQATGSLSFQTRSGNTAEVDETWTDWSEGLSASGKVTSPSARYLQFRVNWDKDKDAVLSSVSVAYLIQNQPPRIIEVKIEDQALAGGGENPQSGEIPMPLRFTAKKISWQVQDADNDPLGIRIYYREESEEQWLSVNTDNLIIGNEFLWNTESVPDGKYLFKVEVSDEATNPAGRRLVDEHISAPQLVDNTKPVIKGLEINEKKLVCRGVAEDSFSYINRIEYALDGGEWHLVPSEDGLFDQAAERFNITLANVVVGAHVLVIRTFDALGNMAVARKSFKR